MKRLVFVLLIGLIGYGFAQSDTVDVLFNGTVDPICSITGSANGTLVVTASSTPGTPFGGFTSGTSAYGASGTDGAVVFSCNSANAQISAPNPIGVSGANPSVNNPRYFVEASNQGGSFTEIAEESGAPTQNPLSFGTGSGTTEIRFRLEADANLPNGTYQYLVAVVVTPQ